MIGRDGNHPLGVLPIGQQLVDGRPNLRVGLGPKLAALGDELLVHILGLLDARELGALAGVCRALHVFSHADELWKAHVLEAVGGAFTYEHSWRATYERAVLRALTPAPAAPARARRWAAAGVTLYSDVLFRPWHCATQPLPEWWLRTPASSTAIARVDTTELSPEQFARAFDAPGIPVVLAGAASGWAALGLWRRPALLERFGERAFGVGEMEMRLGDFFAYCDRATDDPPLYLFDKAFARRAPELAAEYGGAPGIFPPDHFALLPPDQRPDWRWLIVGGARSGSTWHVDPNRTSAWNACVAGGKKWLLTPPHRPPPGVSASEDGATIEAPVSVVEWMSGYLPQARRELGAHLHEATVGPGDVLFVPRGWWHTVLNTEDNTMAVTHNFVSDANLAEVLEYIDPARGTADELVSGVPRAERAALHARLTSALRQQRPEALRRATRPEAVAAARSALSAGLRCARDSSAAKRPRAPSLWAQLTTAEVPSTTSAEHARSVRAAAPSQPDWAGRESNGGEAGALQTRARSAELAGACAGAAVACKAATAGQPIAAPSSRRWAGGLPASGGEASWGSELQPRPAPACACTSASDQCPTGGSGGLSGEPFMFNFGGL